MKELKMKFQRPIYCQSNIRISEQAFFHDDKYHYIVETFLNKLFEKYILQNGRNTKRNEKVCLLADTLMHYSYLMTNGYLCMADIQGTEDAFTDVCFNTRRSDSGLADYGYKGLLSCSVYHECNNYCKLLKIDNEKEETKLSNNYLKKKSSRTSALYDVFNIDKDEEYTPFNSNFITPEVKLAMENDEKIYSSIYFGKTSNKKK